MKTITKDPDVASQSRPLAIKRELSNCGKLLSTVSIIIPVAAEDEAWRALVGDLAELDLDAELLLVGAQAEPPDVRSACAEGETPGHVRWFETTPGRAHQLNYGADVSSNEFLWFLHADSRVTANTAAALERSLDAYPNAIHYFNLKYQNDGPSLTRWNAWGARLRSQYLGLPFGDQGFCLSRELFHRLGRFDELAPYGEDHLLIWEAHRQRVPLRRVNATISTSARKYREHGWILVTLNHGWLTIRQAIPQLVWLVWSRLR